MWEVMSFGERPYWDMSNQDVSTGGHPHRSGGQGVLIPKRNPCLKGSLLLPGASGALGLEMKQAGEREDARREIGKKSQWAGNWTSASCRAFENVQRVYERGRSFGSVTAVLQRDPPR